MSVPRVAGHPDYSSAGVSKFIPELWSAKIAKKYYKKTVLTAICNTEWEGEVKKFGDKVYIRTVADINVFKYEKGMALPKQRPESPDIEMLIDQGHGWNLLLDDVDKAQSDIVLLNKFTEDAAKQLDIEVDREVLGKVYSEADSNNFGQYAGKITKGYNLGYAGGNAVQISKSNVIDYITYCGGVLDENDVPDENRWMVIPSWMAVLLKASDLKDASMMGDPKSVLRSSMLGMIDRFVIYQSNNIPHVTDTHESFFVLFGNKDAITFANQLTKTESLRSTESFDDIVRGLMVWGVKVVKPEALGFLYARR